MINVTNLSLNMLTSFCNIHDVPYSFRYFISSFGFYVNYTIELGFLFWLCCWRFFSISLLSWRICQDIYSDHIIRKVKENVQMKMKHAAIEVAEHASRIHFLVKIPFIRQLLCLLLQWQVRVYRTMENKAILAFFCNQRTWKYSVLNIFPRLVTNCSMWTQKSNVQHKTSKVMPLGCFFFVQ